jgi:hypothetical protein
MRGRLTSEHEFPLKLSQWTVKDETTGPSGLTADESGWSRYHILMNLITVRRGG